MALSQKKQKLIKEYIQECFDNYQDTGNLEKADFDYCEKQILSIFGKKSGSKSAGEKYPCGCSRGRGRPRKNCPVEGNHKQYKEMSESELKKLSSKSNIGNNLENDNKKNSVKKSNKKNMSDANSDANSDTDTDSDSDIDEIVIAGKYNSHSEYFEKLIRDRKTDFAL